MKYRIRDLQFACRYFADGEIYNSKKRILDQLASYHNIDYEGVKDNDEPYEDIWEFLNTLKNDKERLDWILQYGEWQIEKVKGLKRSKIKKETICMNCGVKAKRETFKDELGEYISCECGSSCDIG